MELSITGHLPRLDLNVQDAQDSSSDSETSSSEEEEEALQAEISTTRQHIQAMRDEISTIRATNARLRAQHALLDDILGYFPQVDRDQIEANSCSEGHPLPEEGDEQEDQ